LLEKNVASTAQSSGSSSSNKRNAEDSNSHIAKKKKTKKDDIVDRSLNVIYPYLEPHLDVSDFCYLLYIKIKQL
jgi:hypothetical protein